MNVAKLLFHVFGLSAVTAFCLWMSYIFYSILSHGYYFAYEPDVAMATAEFVLTAFSLVYVAYLQATFYLKITKQK